MSSCCFDCEHFVLCWTGETWEWPGPYNTDKCHTRFFKNITKTLVVGQIFYTHCWEELKLGNVEREERGVSDKWQWSDSDKGETLEWPGPYNTDKCLTRIFKNITKTLVVGQIFFMQCWEELKLKDFERGERGVSDEWKWSDSVNVALKFIQLRVNGEFFFLLNILYCTELWCNLRVARTLLQHRQMSYLILWKCNKKL